VAIRAKVGATVGISRPSLTLPLGRNNFLGFKDINKVRPFFINILFIGDVYKMYPVGVRI
jgi:hypothetical protein